MSSPSPGSDFWTYQFPMAQLRTAALQGQVDVTNPQRGVHGLRLDGQPVEGRLLRVSWAAEAKTTADTAQEDSWPSRLADAYVRGDDLVAAYQPHADWPYAPQIYWSADTARNASDAIAALRLVVSIQTDLLDTHPLLAVASQMPADEVLHFDVAEAGPLGVRSLGGQSPQTIDPQGEVSCLLRRLPGGRLSYAEMMPGDDFRQLTIRHDAGTPSLTRWQLFSDFLEKGVIRRARVGLAFLPREDDVRLAAACCQALKARPLPLTT